MLRTYAIILVLVVGIASWLGPVRGDHSASQKRIWVGADKGSFATGQGAASQAQAVNDQAQAVNELDHGIELTRDGNGYFFADVVINGAPVHMLVDTGATVIALSRNDAQMAGIATPIGMNDVVGQGADGAVKGVEIRLDKVSLGDKTAEGVPAIVLNSGGQSLLGQSFLSKFASVKIEGDKMILR
jgi:aspartyl protease family protein